MFTFSKICDIYENLSTVEKGAILTEKTALILAKLHALSIPGVEPLTALAGFIIGSVAADGRVNEQEYLLIYPALVHVFGEDVDLARVKASFRLSGDGRRMVLRYTEELVRVLDLLDESVKNDIVILCLCIAAIDGRISLKEKNYIRRICTACHIKNRSPTGLLFLYGSEHGKLFLGGVGVSVVGRRNK